MYKLTLLPWCSFWKNLFFSLFYVTNMKWIFNQLYVLCALMHPLGFVQCLNDSVSVFLICKKSID